MRLGIADHLGWAVVVAAAGEHDVVDRRRIELIEPGISQAPIHYDRGRLDLTAMTALVADARESIARTASAAFDEIAAAVAGPITSISLRAWPADFPTDLEVQWGPPYEARADAIMYRQELAELAHARGWDVQLYDARTVIEQAANRLGDRAHEILHGPRARLGAPWTKDHRVAFAAAIVAG